jgi:hypothetical protein
MRLLSTLNVATLLSLLIGICIFYDHFYRDAYLGSFGLDPNAVRRACRIPLSQAFSV